MKSIIAGGGTGGHLYPGIALAEEIRTRHPKNEVLFVGTARGLEARVVPEAGFRLELIDVVGLKGKRITNLLLGLIRLPRALFQAWRILRREKPDVVVGVGGYASGPIVLVAALTGVRTAIQEQNALPGFTNKLLGRFVDAVFIAFKEARPYFAEKKIHLLGNPTRRAFLDNYLKSKIPSPKFTLLITGGSQGAHRLNLAVLDAMKALGPLAQELIVVHQTGKADREEIARRYEELRTNAEVVEFITDMATAYARADLIICRAGAATLAEVTVARKAAILVPFPYATDNHQEVNARSLVDAGAALLFRESELNADNLAAAVRELHDDPARRQKMERASGLLGRPEAAREIINVCWQMVASRVRPK